jgi:hypothetical protein
MSDNKALWNSVCVTDPKAVKEITGKQYRGNSPKPYWIVEQLTAKFGPCGKGWGFQILNERMERLTEHDVLHVAVVRFWYMLEGERCELEQIGQTKAVYMTSKGTPLVDEDAPKKSVTDALVKCASYLGFAGDIFAGRWDDSKYVAQANKEWRDREKEAGAEPAPREVAAANSEAGLPDFRRQELDELVLHLIDCYRNGKETDAIRVYYAADTWSAEHDVSTEEHVYVWGELKGESKLRALLKANHPERKAA